MKILFTGKNHSQGLKEQDPTSLASIAKASGHDLVDKVSQKPDLVICVDYEKPALSLVRHAKSHGIKTVLVANEPQVVIPQHSQFRIRKEFDKVLDVGRPYANPLLRWPQTWTPISDNDARHDRVVLVNADKWSFVRGQHYWLRVAASRLERLDVFGYGWDRPFATRFAHRVFEFWRTIANRCWPNFQGAKYVFATPKSFKGSVSDKLATMSDYKVALVIENSSELITEKLFDAWFAGCVPVYLGPPVESFGIPSNLVVAVEKPNLVSVRLALESALSIDREQFIKEVREFLGSKGAESWTAEQALGAVLNEARKGVQSKFAQR